MICPDISPGMIGFDARGLFMKKDDNEFCSDVARFLTSALTWINYDQLGVVTLVMMVMMMFNHRSRDS